MLRCVHRLEDAVTGICVAVFVTALTIQVFFRYIFNNPLPWPEEVAKFSFVWCCFFGAAAGTHRKAHIAIEVLVAKFPVRWRQAMSAGVHLCILAVLAVLVKSGLDLVQLSSTSKLPAINVPLAYLVLPLPVSAALMMLDFGKFFVENVRTWRDPSLAGAGDAGIPFPRSEQGA